MAINTQGPQFTPSSVGSTWVDPKTKEKWQYTAQGWQKEGSGDIQADTKAKGTFEVKPDEEKSVKLLQEGGSSQDQINQALIQRRNILGNIGQNGTSNTPGTPTDQTSDLSDPFGGKSKKAVLLDAFNKGVKDPKELD